MPPPPELPRTVVGAVIVRPHPAGGPGGGAGLQVLAARRTRPASLAGRWEFPGGKVEPGEAPADALVRELREELAVTVVVGAEVSDAGRPWPISDALELRLFLARVVAGEPTAGADHDEVRWLSARELGDVSWLESDDHALGAVAEVLVGGDAFGAQ
ncbi:(deoxy)nucleoside triphosphate pyrophosphohydrolase [Nocardioides sp. SYSU DS0651]|uniref:(deoxy)nucleoside triphosphate pyrophosphohydrolase n=1 Tax=Nocardioides sp. SYSU DS0651 TaxID=3415955 RepID=UPI003F4CA8E1